jgi:tight adherence protein B
VAAYLAAGQLLIQWEGALGLRFAAKRQSFLLRLRKAGFAAGRLGPLFGMGPLIGAVIFYMVAESLAMAAWGALLGAGFPWAYAAMLEKKQMARFCSQMPGVLDQMSGALRSGQSLNQALQSLALEAPQPSAGHFGVVAQTLSLGTAPEIALDELARRMKGQACEEELRMLATSVSVTRASGGNLAEILSQLSETVRERARLRAEIDSITAQGRLSGWIVGSLPLLILLALQFLDPGLLAPMFNTPLGLGLLGLGVLLESIGAFLINRIVSVDL